jgi:hypothetical protein
MKISLEKFTLLDTAEIKRVSELDDKAMEAF